MVVGEGFGRHGSWVGLFVCGGRLFYVVYVGTLSTVARVCLCVVCLFDFDEREAESKNYLN